MTRMYCTGTHTAQLRGAPASWMSGRGQSWVDLSHHSGQRVSYTHNSQDRRLETVSV